MRARTRRLRSACLVMIASCDHHRTDPPAAPTADADDDRQPHRPRGPPPFASWTPGWGGAVGGWARTGRPPALYPVAVPARPGGRWPRPLQPRTRTVGGEPTPMGPEAQVEAGGRDAAALLGRLLGDDLVAVYLGGAGALGGGAAGQSDVDRVAGCAAPP